MNYGPCNCWTGIISLHAHFQVVYYNCVKFHQYQFLCSGAVALNQSVSVPLFRSSCTQSISISSSVQEQFHLWDIAPFN